jgi:hypothetical protein
LARNARIARHIAVAVAVALALAGCAAGAGPPLSDEERCGRYGGIWQMGVCKTIG